MPETNYRKPDPSLLELIANNSVAAPAAPPSVDQQASTLSPGAQNIISQLETQAFAPEPELPPEEKLSLGRRLALALASGGSTYASLIRGMPSVDYMGQFMERRDRERALRGRKASEDAANLREKARFKLNRILGEEQGRQAAADRAKEVAEERAYQEKKTTETRQYNEGVAAAQAAAVAARQKEDDLRGLKFKAAAEGAMFGPDADEPTILSALAKAAQVKKSGDDDKVSESDKKQFQEDIALIEQTVNGNPGKNDGLATLLETGQISVDQAMSLVENKIRWSTLPGPLRKKLADAAQHYIAPILSRQRMNEDLAAGSPPGPEPGEVGMAFGQPYNKTAFAAGAGKLPSLPPLPREAGLNLLKYGR